MSTDYLAKKNIESARANAELFLAFILNCKRLDLYMMYDRPLNETELNRYREYLRRRSNFEPLQYIIGKVEFYGLELNVSGDVLIPRQETELLVENVIENVPKADKLKILDIGTGSGNIVIALAVNLPNAELFAIDVSEKAVQLAKQNAKAYDLEDRISFECKDILSINENDYPDFDVIVSNPPYVSKTDYQTLQKEIKEFEPDFAVTDFSDGYTFYRRIISSAKKMLNTGGSLFFEIAEGQSGQVRNLLLKNEYRNVVIIKDYQGINRIISAVNK